MHTVQRQSAVIQQSIVFKRNPRQRSTIGLIAEYTIADRALMTVIVLAHHANDNGTGELIYDQICAATGLSRAKVSGGLAAIATEQIVVRKMDGRSTYRLEGYQRNRGWGKLPARGLYDGDRVAAFDHFHLRRDTELNALELYLLFVAMRNNALNAARIGYEKIREYSGIR
jgi:hypothetical protein